MSKTNEVLKKIEILGNALSNARESLKDSTEQSAKLRRQLALAEEMIQTGLKSPETIPNLLEALKKIAERPQVDDVRVVNPTEFPKEMNVSNLPKEIGVNNFPDSFKAEVDFPDEYRVRGWKSLVSEIGLVKAFLRVISKKFESVDFSKLKAVVSGRVAITNKEASEAIPVRLVSADLQRFYDAMFSVLGSGGPIASDETLSEILVAIQALGSTGATSVGDGTATVTTAGTRVQLPSQACKKVIIQTLETNTGIIVVGGSTVVAAAGSRRGVALFATQSQAFEVSNLDLLYIDSTVNGEKINFYFEA